MQLLAGQRSSSWWPRVSSRARLRGSSACSGRTTLVLAAGRGQIGEFSFILGQSGVALGALTDAQYSLILAGAIVSITVNPLMMRAVEPAERWLRKRPALWQLLDRGPAENDADTPHAHRDHVVIVGCGRVGRHIAETLKRLDIPRLVIESDPIVVEKLRELGVPVLYGEADNSEILAHASLVHRSRARHYAARRCGRAGGGGDGAQAGAGHPHHRARVHVGRRQTASRRTGSARWCGPSSKAASKSSGARCWS